MTEPFLKPSASKRYLFANLLTVKYLWCVAQDLLPSVFKNRDNKQQLEFRIYCDTIRCYKLHRSQYVTIVYAPNCFTFSLPKEVVVLRNVVTDK
jgi:hypothetical protein